MRHLPGKVSAHNCAARGKICLKCERQITLTNFADLPLLESTTSNGGEQKYNNSGKLVRQMNNTQSDEGDGLYLWSLCQMEVNSLVKPLVTITIDDSSTHQETKEHDEDS